LVASLILFALRVASPVPHVQLQSHTIITYRQVQLSNAIIAAASIKVRIGVVWVDFYDSSEVSDGFLVVAESFEADASVVEGMDVFTV